MIMVDSDHDGGDEHDEGEGIDGHVLVEDVTNDGSGSQADFSCSRLLKHGQQAGKEGEDSGLHCYGYGK